MYPKGRAWIELNEENLKANVEELRRISGSRGRIMAAVKANAYGHGATQVAGILRQCGVADFCVASLTEGVELRRAGIGGQILILGYTHPCELAEAAAYDMTQTVVDSAYARELERFGQPIKVHIGIDTGMHRLGERFERIEDILDMWNIPNLQITGVFSHLCVADSADVGDREYTLHQIAGFKKVVDQLHQAGITGFAAHLLSSYGVLNYPEYHFDYPRIGIALYGILSSPDDHTKAKPCLRPVLSLKSRIQSVRTLERGESAGYGLTFTAGSRRSVAALSIGYADGIPRVLSNTGYVLVHGKKAPVVGRICMDQMMVDVTDIPEAAPGEEAVLIGRSGIEEITAPVFASWAGTIANEVLSRLGSRLERIVQ